MTTDPLTSQWPSPDGHATAGERLRVAFTAGDRIRSAYRSRTVLGTFLIELPTPRTVRALALAGFDFIVVDLEHSFCGMETLANLVAEAQLAGLPVLVRVWSLSDGLIGRVLDAGANGVMVPHVQDQQDAIRAVAAARYGPVGNRGLAPLTTYRSLGVGQAVVGDSVLVVVQIEGLEAVEHAAEIAAIEGVDAVLIGPYDLSQALGRPGDVTAPEIVDAAGRVAAACRDRAMLGMYVDDPATSSEWAHRGFGLQCVGFDGRMLLDGARALLTTARAES